MESIAAGLFVIVVAVWLVVVSNYYIDKPFRQVTIGEILAVAPKAVGITCVGAPVSLIALAVVGLLLGGVSLLCLQFVTDVPELLVDLSTLPW